MAINKDLNLSPYFDDFDDSNNYHRIMFKPSVAVQVRELNQLQTILQSQIEKFGNNIYKRGTIIDGVNFIYYSSYPYIKIEDSQIDGTVALPSEFVSKFVVDPTTNLVAHIVNSAEGFETRDPDLKTLYLRYVNSGNTGIETEFSPGATLTVYEHLNAVDDVIITNGSSGFANSDTLVFCSALEITLNSNTDFTVGETIAQTGNTNFALVTEITTYRTKKVLRIKPRTADLTNTAISSSIWQFTNNTNILGLTSGAVAKVVSSIGSGANAALSTTADIGKINNISIIDGGEDYYVAPYVTVKSSGINSAISSRNYNDLNLVAKNYIGQIKVAQTTNAVGIGYAFGVTGGVIYQKGFFSRVEPQTIIVSKYSPTPDGVSIGFDTLEDIIDSNADSSLLDNCTDTPGIFAPGADRLKLTPTLTVVNTDIATSNGEFLSIVDFSNGNPFREFKKTQFNSIVDDMAGRTYDESGNFVVDEFLVTTVSTTNSALEGSSFSVVVDPGRGYINGYKVETSGHFNVVCNKGVNTATANTVYKSIDYGNYVLVKQAVGKFDCSVGDEVDLMSAAVSYVSNTTLVTTGTVPTTGTVIGAARIRNMVYDSGPVGTEGAIYRLYLFNIRMSAGQNFTNVRAIRTANDDSIADTILTFDATSNSNICQLKDNNTGTSLIIPVGSNATAKIANVHYTYRDTTTTVPMANNGTTSFLLAAADEYYAYNSASLTDNELKTIILVPTGNNIALTANTDDGTVNVASGSNTFAVSNTAVINQYDVGDFIALWSNSTTYTVRRVTSKTSTNIQVDSNVGFTNASANYSKVFPKHVPIPLDRIPGATGTLSGGDKTLTISLGRTHYAAGSVACAMTYDVRVREATVQAKTADRDNYVKFNLSTAGVNGPWCLGIPDVFRLKSVYVHTSSTVNVNSTDITDQFFIDHNQNADYYGLSYLYKKNNTNFTLTSSHYLLVKFDAFTSSPGVFTINSYVSSNVATRLADDALSLANLGTKVSSYEIPEVNTSGGKYYDLANSLDFRPVAANTAAYAKTVAAANTNPSSTLTFSGSDKKFPVPQSGVSYTYDYFLGRTDIVIADKNNSIRVIPGVPSSEMVPQNPPSDSLLLNTVVVPPYPALPVNVSPATNDIIKRRISNDGYLNQRLSSRVIKPTTSPVNSEISQPRAYSMAAISKLEKRISDLEYYVALNNMESSLKDKVIPSAMSPSINRFKFGFYADDYSSQKNSDLNHVEYKSNVIGSRVVPISDFMVVTHGSALQVAPIAAQIPIITQSTASQYIAPTAPANTTPTPTTNTVVVPVPSTPSPPVNEFISAADVTDVTIVRSHNTIPFYQREHDIGFTIAQRRNPGNITISWNFPEGSGTDVKLYVFRNEESPDGAAYPGGLIDTTGASNSQITLSHYASIQGDSYLDRTYKVVVVTNKNVPWTVNVTFPMYQSTQLNAPTGAYGLKYRGYVTSMVPNCISPANYMEDARIQGQFGLIVDTNGAISKGKGYIDINVAGLKANTKHTLRLLSTAIYAHEVTSQIGPATDFFELYDPYGTQDLTGSQINSNENGIMSIRLKLKDTLVQRRDNIYGYYDGYNNVSQQIDYNDLAKSKVPILASLESVDGNSECYFFINTSESLRLGLERYGTYSVSNLYKDNMILTL